jgi:hypothetical protein
MDLDDRPRVFISYRHLESQTDPGFNLAHREWVGNFARELESFGIRPIWDVHIRECLSKHSSIDPFELPLCAEVSRAFPAICHAFMPVVTPAYLERVGFVAGERTNSIPYGVVFEEWQGGLHAAELGLSIVLPVIRAGRPQQLPMTYFSSSILTYGLVDVRGDQKDNYSRAFDLIRKATSNIDVHRNPYSAIEPSIWCDTYIEWARVKYSVRSRIPVDSWWFNTGYANEFLGAVSGVLRATQATWYDANDILLAWQEALREEQAKHVVALTYSDIDEHVATALRAARGDQGWNHLARTTDFAKSTLRTISDADKTGFVRAYNDTGVALLRLGERIADPKSISEAIEFFTKALEKVSLGDNRAGWLRIRRNLSSALAVFGKRTGNTQALQEALAGYEAILEVTHVVQEKEWRTEAEDAIRDIRMVLDQSAA